jgi:prepilin-type N-terminal cleavage/methylation domain-containing protein
MELKGESKMNCISLKELKGEVKMKRAFTLIEMMIVIAVIAILVGIALPHFRGMQEEGWSVKAAGELRTLATAIESYYIHNGKAYPDPQPTRNTTWQSSLPGNGPTIVASTLYDPFITGSTEYSYVTSGSLDANSPYYVVWSVGPDASADITGISTAGVITGGPGDDIYFTNAAAGTGGF